MATALAASLIGYLREKCCGGSFKSGVGFGYARGWTAAPTYAKRVRVQAAPEPDDVKWENMYLDLAYQRKQGWRTFGVTVLLLVLALLLLIACKVSQVCASARVGDRPTTTPQRQPHPDTRPSNRSGSSRACSLAGERG